MLLSIQEIMCVYKRKTNQIRYVLVNTIYVVMELDVVILTSCIESGFIMYNTVHKRHYNDLIVCSVVCSM